MNEYLMEDIYVGLKESFTVKIEKEMLEMFLKISGDNNILHTDKEYAISKGFNDKVVYGMLTASFYSKLAGVYLPGKYCLLHEVNSSFLKPVYVGDELLISGEVKQVYETYKQIEIKAEIRRNGEKVSRALIKAGII